MSAPGSESVIAILGAMPSEVQGLAAAMTVESSGTTAGIPYWAGELGGRRIILARCGMGKVSAAMGVQRLIDEWRVGCLVVCGLAGGLAAGLHVGDIIIGESFVQYDMDASPIVPRFELPGLEITRLQAEAALVSTAEAAAREVAAELSNAMPLHSSGGAVEPQVLRGLIATGDQFVKDEQKHAILNDFPDALCVEMEGGAIAQVCYLNGVPFVIVRIISDTADGDAPADFLRFVEEQAPAYTVSIVRRLLPALP
jgi:adenosylhomocysteine nucleosidase